MMNKKIIAPISLSLSILLITPSVLNATKLSDFVMSTSTSAGSWSDPLGGGTYLNGGDFKIKLKTTSSYAPLMNFKLPSEEIGCSGMSISGGFLSFLGLDKLQNLLSDAGSSLMFGIILGIEFTLPAVGAVFAKIRAWANALQSLLQNGCNIGKALAKGSKLGDAFHTKELSSAINGPFDKLDAFVGEGDGLLKDIQELAQCSGDPADPKCKHLDDAITSLGQQIKYNLSNGGAISISGKMAKNSVSTVSTKNAVAKVFNLSDFYATKKINCSDLTVNSIDDTDVLIDSLKYVFFGDIGADGESIVRMESKIDSPNCKLKMPELASDISGAITTGGSSSFPIPTFSSISAIISDPKDAAEILVNGFEKINEKYSEVANNTIKIPDRKIAYLDLPIGIASDNLTPTDRVRTVYVSSQEESGSAMDLVWDGAFKESLKGIRTIVDGQTGQSWRLSTSYAEYDTTSTGSISTPLLLPGIKKYANVIAKMEKRSQGATAQTEQLKVYLAKVNAIYFAETLISGIETRVTKLASGVKGDAKIINDYLHNVALVKKEVGVILKEMRKELNSDDLTTKFKKLEEEQTIDSIKAGRS